MCRTLCVCVCVPCLVVLYKAPSLNIGFYVCVIHSDIDTSMSVWEGIVVTPSEKAYEKPADKDEEEEDGVDKESDDQMETQEQ